MSFCHLLPCFPLPFPHCLSSFLSSPSLFSSPLKLTLIPLAPLSLSHRDGHTSIAQWFFSSIRTPAYLFSVVLIRLTSAANCLRSSAHAHSALSPTIYTFLPSPSVLHRHRHQLQLVSLDSTSHAPATAVVTQQSTQFDARGCPHCRHSRGTISSSREARYPDTSARHSRHHVVEEVGPLDGHHQALCQLSRHRCELAADGPIRREAVCRCVLFCQPFYQP